METLPDDVPPTVPGVDDGVPDAAANPAAEEWHLAPGTEQFLGGSLSRHHIIAATVLAAVALVNVIGYCILHLVGTKRRADPNRSAAPWAKISVVLLTPATACALAIYSVALYVVENDTEPELLSDLASATAHLSILWRLLDRWAQAAILVMISATAIGLHSVTRGAPAFWHRFVRFGVAASGVVVFALSSAAYGLKVSALEGSSDDDLSRSATHAGRLDAAAVILLWVATLGVTALSGTMVIVASRMRSLAGLLFFTAVLDLVGNTWVMVWHIRYGLQSHAQPDYAGILHVVLQIWTSVGVMVTIWFVLRRKAGGIWTTGRYGEMRLKEKGPR